MPRRDVPQILPAACALLVVLALAVTPAIDARPKGKRDEVVREDRQAKRDARRDDGGRADRAQSRERTRRERNRAGGATAAELSAPWLPVDNPSIDDPFINEELIAAAAAAGEIYDPAPPPVPRRAWDDEAAELVAWQTVARIDAGVTDDAVEMTLEPALPPDDAASDSPFTHGWVRTALLLQDELAGDSSPGDDEAEEPRPESEDPASDAPAPVPVEDELVVRNSTPPKDPTLATPEDLPVGSSEPIVEVEPLDAAVAAAPGDGARRGRGSRERRTARDEDRNRDVATTADATPNEEQASRRASRTQRRLADWSGDRYFSGGSAVVWDGSLDVAGTNDDALYVTQRTGSGTGERRGFAYAIPVDGNGTYLVRLYFAEPLWGTVGNREDGDGRRVFAVTGEGQTLVADLDIYAEAGPLTALVKEAEVEVSDGELNLGFVATAGEPLVAAIEVLAPAS